MTMLVVKKAGGKFKEVPQQASDDGVPRITLTASEQTADFRTAYCAVGGSAVVPNTDLSAILSADIIKWDGFVIESKTVTFDSTSADDGIANEMLGWWYTINAGSATIARQRLREALDTATGSEVSMYTPAATIHANENKASGVIARDGKLQIANAEDITDIYIMPVAAVTGAALNGSMLLTCVVS